MIFTQLSDHSGSRAYGISFLRCNLLISQGSCLRNIFFGSCQFLGTRDTITYELAAISMVKD